MQPTSLLAVLLLTLALSFAGSALAESAGMVSDPTGGWMGLFAQMPLAGALMWIFQRVMERDREREALLLQREREREAAAAERDKLFTERDKRTSDALTELGRAVDHLAQNCQRGRNDLLS